MTDRFSLRYVDKGLPERNSPRARRRLYAEFSRLARELPSGDEFSAKFASKVVAELGIEVPSYAMGYLWDDFFSECELRDLLDSVSLIRDVLLKGARYAQWAHELPRFIANVRRIFQEENLSYSLDANAVVHYAPDQEFVRNLDSALSCLNAEKYAQVRDAFQRARDAIGLPEPDAHGAIRNVFEAAESLHKRITGSRGDLDDREVDKVLRPYVDRKMAAADGVAKSAAGRFVSAFADWVSAAHPYRHGHDANVPVSPPLHLTVAVVSSGATFIRWLVTLDQS